jgi:peptide/nickel transport system substrate-binding protein
LEVSRFSAPGVPLNPKWVRVIAIVVVVGLVLAGIGIYYSVTHANSSCGLQSTNPLIVDQAEETDSADPQVASSTPDWGLVQQLYQTLVMYNQSSLTQFTPVLAQNWTASGSSQQDPQSVASYNWNFTLRQGVHFSNGDPFNAYVMWYSLYRLIALQGIDQYLLAENFWFPFTNYYADWNSSAANLTNWLNTWNFDNPTSNEIAIMEESNQSFQVLGPYEIEFNLGYGYNGLIPYAYFLAEMSTPGAAAVDPNFIQANGGIQPGNPSTPLATTAVGTGPYLMTAYSSTAGYTLKPDPNYWAATVATQEPWNNNLQPAKVSIQVNFQESQEITINDLKTKAVAAASFAYFGPSAINQVKGIACVTVQELNIVFSGAGGSWWVFMDQQQYPFNNLSVRAAIVHAINYSQVATQAFGGYSSEWVGPVAPGHPYYNPANLTPYQYNLALAKQEIADSPCANNACAGMVFNYEYLTSGSNDWEDAALIIQSDLSQIGITINPVGVDLPTFYALQVVNNGVCTSDTSQDGGPFYIGQDFYSSDYISPDDWTQNDFASTGSANICQSEFNTNATHDGPLNVSLDNLVYNAAGDTNVSNLTSYYTQMTEIMYQNYTNAWFAVPTLFAVYNSNLAGYFQTPMGSTELDTMSWNTIYST